MVAAKNGSVDCVRFLAEKEAGFRNGNDQTAFEIAAVTMNQEIYDLLSKYPEETAKVKPEVFKQLELSGISLN